MRRKVEGVRGIEALAVRSSMMVLLASPLALADGDGDGPELTPPANMPAVAQPAAPIRSRPAVPATPPGNGRAVLALPGITTPAARSPSVITSTPSSPSTGSPPPALEPPGELTLDGPIEMPGVAPPGRARAGTSAGSSTRSIPLEPLPMGDSPLPGDPDSRSTTVIRRSSPSSSRPEPAQAPTARRNRFFGLIPGPAVAPPASRTPTPARSSVVEVPPADPSVDAALKKRVERQALQMVGDRARSIEVRVEGKDVSVLARGVRFYQKRAVRKTLESLPALSGARATIDIVD